MESGRSKRKGDGVGEGLSSEEEEGKEGHIKRQM